MINIIIGLIGMGLILTAFFLTEFFKNFNTNTKRYNIINILGAGTLIYYSYNINSWPFLILNTVWFVVALVKLVKISRINYFL